MPVNGLAGYRGIGPEQGTCVKKEDAYGYAMDRCLHGTLDEIQEFREMLVEWFYSGNWVEDCKEDLDGKHNKYICG